MDEDIRFVSKSECERIRLIREARAIYRFPAGRSRQRAAGQGAATHGPVAPMLNAARLRD
jgi:hypothetical protein